MRSAVIGVVLLAACGHASDDKPPPRPDLHYTPLAGGDTFDQLQTPSCLVPTIAELRKHPHWMVRIDDRGSFVGNIDAPPVLDAVIERDASGATWHDGWLRNVRVPLGPAEVAALDRALAGRCTENAAWARRGDDVRWFEIGYGSGGASSIQLAESSEVTLALAPIFDATRAAHITAQLAKARTVVMTVNGSEYVERTKSWRKRTITIDLTKATITDAEAVEVLDWTAGQPDALPVGPQAVSGTLTVAGATRPVAVSLDLPTERDRINLGVNPALHEIWQLSGANMWRYDFR